MMSPELSLRLGGYYISKLPEGTPYFLTAIDGEDVTLDITPLTPSDFWDIGRLLNVKVRDPEVELVRHINGLSVYVYMLPPETDTLLGDTDALV